MTDEPHDQTALVPVRTQTVDFYGDTLPAGQLADGTILVPVRPIVEALGLTWPSQFNRLKRDPVLTNALGIFIMETPGGQQPFVALPLKLLPGFLFGLNASRVKPELREKILRYQADCYEVLWNAFKGDIVPVPSTPSLPASTGALRTLEIAEAVYHLAKQQYEFEQTVHDLSALATDTAERVTALELRLGGRTTVDDAQATEIAGAVKAVAAALEAAGTPNGYARVYSELYRRFRITGYKALPRARYEEALSWLSTWYDEVSGPADPV